MANTLTGTVIAEKYRLGEIIRNGESADLYDARHVLMDKQVSVRVLKPSLAADSANVEEFFQNARTASGIHDRIFLDVTDFGSDREGFVYSIHEPFSGKSLKAVIADEGAFPVHSSVEIARQISNGLAVSHVAGRIHGNLSTENVFLTGVEGIGVKVLDFGSQDPIEREAIDPSAFASIPPELCAGSSKPSERGDIYSLGAILYEMLAGVPPFTGEKPSDVMLKHLEEMPPPLSSYRKDLPDGLEAVIVKALSKNPEMRQQSAEELSLDLTPIGEMASAQLETPPNNLWKTAFIVLVGISALAGFLIYGTYTNTTDPVTALQPDANGLPVQPINPATGAEEQALAAMPAYTTDSLANSNLSQQPGTLPGGDGYNPWAGGGIPPGAPAQVAPGGQVVTVGPATGNPLMPSGILYDTSTGNCVDAGTYTPVPCPMAGKPKPSATPKQTPANSNSGEVPQSTPVPANAVQPKQSPSPRPPNRNPRATPTKKPEDKGIE